MTWPHASLENVTAAAVTASGTVTCWALLTVGHQPLLALAAVLGTGIVLGVDWHRIRVLARTGDRNDPDVAAVRARRPGPGVTVISSPDGTLAATRVGTHAVMFKPVTGIHPEHLQAMIAHEIGHLEAGHHLHAWATSAHTSTGAILTLGILTTSITSVVSQTTLSPAVLAAGIWWMIVAKHTNRVGRHFELEADQYAAECGYRDALVDAIVAVHHSSNGWIGTEPTHPDPRTRIGALLLDTTHTPNTG